MCKLAGMNYLAHLHLGGDAPAQLLGSLYGDFVKGPLAGQWPADIEAAIRLHRRIDVFTDNHPLQLQARARFPLSGGVVPGSCWMCFSTIAWRCTGRTMPRAFADFYRAGLSGAAGGAAFARAAGVIAPRMAAQDWLGSYREFAVLEQVVAGIDRRLSRPGLLAGAMAELQRLYQPLLEDFQQFYPELQAFVAQRAASGGLGRLVLRNGRWLRARCAEQRLADRLLRGPRQRIAI